MKGHSITDVSFPIQLTDSADEGHEDWTDLLRIINLMVNNKILRIKLNQKK